MSAFLLNLARRGVGAALPETLAPAPVPSFLAMMESSEATGAMVEPVSSPSHPDAPVPGVDAAPLLLPQGLVPQIEAASPMILPPQHPVRELTSASKAQAASTHVERGEVKLAEPAAVIKKTTVPVPERRSRHEPRKRRPPAEKQVPTLPRPSKPPVSVPGGAVQTTKIAPLGPAAPAVPAAPPATETDFRPAPVSPAMPAHGTEAKTPDLQILKNESMPVTIEPRERALTDLAVTQKTPPPELPPVQVRIGCIEVRVTKPPAPAAPRPAAVAGSVGFDAYVSARNYLDRGW